MRWIIVSLALALAACDGAVESKSRDEAGAEVSGYTMEIRASGSDQTYLITAPDGRVVGARAAEGASALMDATRAAALLADPPVLAEAEGERGDVSIRLPGFSLSASGDDENPEGEKGRVAISVGGDRGEHVTVHADEGGPGEADDRAYVRITGADEESVRHFIDEAEHLSPEVKAQMRSALGLQ